MSFQVTDPSKQLRRQFRGSCFRAGAWLTFAALNPLAIQAIGDAVRPYVIPKWGAESLRHLRHEPCEIPADVFEAATKLGAIAGKRDTFLHELEKHNPSFDARMSKEHEVFKGSVARIAKEAFPAQIKEDVGNLTIEDNFHSLLNERLPRYFGQHRLAFNPITYDLNCGSIPKTFNQNFEIAEVIQSGDFTYQMWGRPVRRDILVVGTNYTEIDGSIHKTSLQEVLGLYDGDLLINSDTTAKEVNATILKAKFVTEASTSYLDAKGKREPSSAISLNGFPEKREAHQAMSLYVKAAHSLVGDSQSNAISVEDLLGEVKAHEVGHGFRDQEIRFLRPEKREDLAALEEAFACVAELGYAPRFDNVVFYLIDAQYLSDRYEEHIRAKRTVWNLMIECILENPGRYGVKIDNSSADARRASAIGGMNSLFEDKDLRLLLSNEVKDKLVADSIPTLPRLLNDINGGETFPLVMAFGNLLDASLKRRWIRGYKKLKRAFYQIDSLSLEQEDKDTIYGLLQPYSRLDENSLSYKLAGLSKLLQIGGPRAVPIAVSLCECYYRLLPNPKKTAEDLLDAPVRSVSEFTAVLLEAGISQCFGLPTLFFNLNAQEDTPTSLPTKEQVDDLFRKIYESSDTPDPYFRALIPIYRVISHL